MRDPSMSSPGAHPAFVPVIGLREVLESAPDLIFCCDTEGRFVWVSSRFEALTGHAPGHLIGRVATQVVSEPDRLRLVRAFRRQLRRPGTQVAARYSLLRQDATTLVLEARVNLYERADGERYFVGVAHEAAAAPAAPAPVPVAQQAAAPQPAAAPAGAPASPDAISMLEARVRELQLQLDEAREDDRLKHEVLATLSQELRPPMDAVFSTAALLHDSQLSAEQRRYVEIIQGASQTLMHLVGDAYDHAQLETGRMAIESIEFDLRVTAQQVRGVLTPQAEARGVELDLRVEPLVPSRLKGDPGRLRQVLLNLGSNAIRYAKTGRVEIRMERESEDDAMVTLMFRVTDPGSGPDAERRANAFREHGMSRQDIARAAGTPELGLSVSRRLVHLMGGLVGVDALPAGGYDFWFRLSFEKQALGAVPPATAGVSLRDLRVLVADGIQTDRRRHAETMSAWGCDVVEAEDGMAALDRIRGAAASGKPFRVALLDMGLEGLDGESLASAVRADDALDVTRLVMTTRLGRPGDAARAREVGFAGYLVKPLDASQLFDALTELAASPEPAAGESRPLVTRHSLAEARRGRVRILLVEDDAVNQLVTQSALHRVGFHVEVATNGREAIERIEQVHWDLVLVDIHLPDLDGARFTTAIRARERGAWRTPIVGLSYAGVAPVERERCVAAGMDDLFDRPADLPELAAAVERWAAPAESRVPDAGADDVAPNGPQGRLTVVSGRFDPPRREAEAPAAAPAPAPAQASDAPEGPPVDLEQLNQASMGVPALRSSMLSTFVADVFPRLQRFEAALESGSAESAESEAARLRRMSATVGAVGCARLFGMAEDRARLGRLDELTRLLPAILQEVHRTEEFVTRLVRVTERDAA